MKELKLKSESEVSEGTNSKMTRILSNKKMEEYKIRPDITLKIIMNSQFTESTFVG